MESKKKKELILKTSKEVFARYGYKKTTVEDISNEMGMTKSNLYFYVKSKQDLYNQVVRKAMNEWYSRVIDSLEGIDDIEKRFKSLATNAFRYLNEDHELSQIILKDPSILTLVLRDDNFREINMQSRDTITSLLNEGKEMGVFRDYDSDTTAEFFFTLYIMLLRTTYLSRGEAGGPEMFKQALDIIMYGLLA